MTVSSIKLNSSRTQTKMCPVVTFPSVGCLLCGGIALACESVFEPNSEPPHSSTVTELKMSLSWYEWRSLQIKTEHRKVISGLLSPSFLTVSSKKNIKKPKTKPKSVSGPLRAFGALHYNIWKVGISISCLLVK